MSPELSLDPKRVAEFRRLLAGEGRTRIERSALWHAFAKAFPHRPGAEERAWLLSALRALADEGALKLPALKGPRWDRTKLPHVPTSIDIVREKRPNAFAWRTYAWHPDLAWVSEITYLPAQDHEFLRRVHDALARDELGDEAPIKYRSLQLTGSEKMLGQLVRGALFAPGRLSSALLRFVPDRPPLALTEFRPYGDLLVVENAGTYFTASRVLKDLDDAPYSAIGFGDGGRVTASLPTEPSLDRFRSIEYLGDLDWPGLAILHRLQRRLAERRIEARPATSLFNAMMASAEAFGQPDGWASRTKKVPRDAEALLDAFAPPLRERARRILERGRRIPEEVLGPRELRAVWSKVDVSRR